MSTDTALERSTASVAVALLRATRPRQWIKNALVIAAPGAAGVLFTLDPWADVAVAFAALTAASAGTYLVNDIRDRSADRAHPRKRLRPIASGVLPVGVAATAAVMAMSIGVAVPFALGYRALAAIVLAYVVTTTTYSSGLKHVALLELALVAAGFVLRAIAGAVATDVEISRWFLIVVSAAALHLAATKRFAELRDVGGEQRRRVLDYYRSDLLAEVRYATVAVALLGYLLWAFEISEGVAGVPWYPLSAVPFTLAIFRYSAAVHDGAGEAPEDVLLRDRQMLVYTALWALLFAIGTYGGAR